MESRSEKPQGNARSRARRKAVQALYQLHFNPVAFDRLLAQFLEEPDMGQVDPAYFRELVEGVQDNRGELDAALEPLITRRLVDVDPVELAILRMATFELRHRLEVPYRVVINEAIELAKRFGAEDGHKFVNGVLDKLARELRAPEAKAKRR